MQVHRPPVDLGVADMYAAQAAKKAAEAKQAAEIRRKLLRASASIDGESSAFVSFVGERSGGGSQQGNGTQQEPDEGQTQRLPASALRSPAEPPAAPLSIWA